MIPVEEFAKYKNLDKEKAIKMIRDGFYVGRTVGEEWFVDASESTDSASKPSKHKAAVTVSGNNSHNEVIVTDIKMPFLSMVVFMVKWVIASISAFIILFIIFSAFGGVFTSLLGGMRP